MYLALEHAQADTTQYLHLMTHAGMRRDEWSGRKAAPPPAELKTSGSSQARCTSLLHVTAFQTPSCHHLRLFANPINHLHGTARTELDNEGLPCAVYLELLGVSPGTLAACSVSGNANDWPR